MATTIELGRVYYYNNRPVYPIKHESDEFYLCKTSFDHELNTDDLIFCAGCELGTQHATCTCDRDNELLQIIADQIYPDEELIWIKKQHLKEKPIEFKANEKLKAEIEEKKKKIQSYVHAEINFKQNISNLTKTVESIELLIESKRKELENIEKNIESASKELQNKEQFIQQKIQVKNTSKIISIDNYLELIKDSLTLRDLKSGGVDNWEYYGESTRENEEYTKEALSYLI